MPFPEVLGRFALAVIVTTCVCVPFGFILLRITGVPPAYPPLLAQQITAGTINGALLVALGYWFLSSVIPDIRTRNIVFLSLALLLCFASFYLPYRLTYTKSLRFAGVTFAAQIGQCLLHVLVIFGSAICFLSEKSGWG